MKHFKYAAKRFRKRLKFTGELMKKLLKIRSKVCLQCAYRLLV